MDKAALAVGNFLIKSFEYLEADIFKEAIEWIGVEAVGYAVIVIIVSLILLVLITQKKGRR
ncbi:MAG: hypothetical protein ACYDGO_05670 [Smithellaceae bacterium]